MSWATALNLGYLNTLFWEHLMSSIQFLSNNVEWHYCNYIKDCGTHQVWHDVENRYYFSLFYTYLITVFSSSSSLSFSSPFSQLHECTVTKKQKKNWAYPTKTQSRKQFLKPKIQLLYSKLLDPLTPTIAISHWLQQKRKEKKGQTQKKNPFEFK